MRVALTSILAAVTSRNSGARPVRSRSSLLTLSFAAALALCSCARPASQSLVDATMTSAHRPVAFTYGLRRGWRAPSPPPSEPARYMLLAGDMHCHIGPPDQAPHVTRGAAETVELAHAEGLDFVVLTPHVAARFYQDEGERAWVLSSLARMERDINAAGPGSTLFITGFEYTDHRYGHVGAAFLDLSRLLSAVSVEESIKRPERFFEEAVAEGGVLVVNHPLVTPLDSIIPMARANLSWRPFTAAGPFPPEIQAVNRLAQGFEAYNLTATQLRDRYLVGDTEHTLRSTLRRIDDEIVRQGRRMSPVGGSDSHSGHLRATTFVLSESRTTAGIRDALVAGRVCVRDPAACSFEARSRDDAWRSVGSSLPAAGPAMDVRVEGEDIDILVNGEQRAHLGRGGEARVDVDPSRCSVLRVRVGAGYSAPIYVGCPFAG